MARAHGASQRIDRMMKLTGIVLIMILFAVTAFSRQQTMSYPADTVTRRGIVITDPGLATGKATLLLPPDLQYEDFSADTSIFGIWQKTAIPPPLLGGLLEPKADLMATLRAQRAKDSQLKIFRTVLGTVQIGGAAYLAYRALTAKGTPKPIRKK
jgi:hypothetical protein